MAEIGPPKTLLLTFGGGMSGSLGHGRTSNEPIPKEVVSLSDKQIVQIALGGYHTLALTASGQIYSWGYGPALGLGGVSQTAYTPTLIPRFPGAKPAFITAGWKISLAIDESGSIFSWGDNTLGALGDSSPMNSPLPSSPSSSSQSTPSMITALAQRRIVSASCGKHYCVAISDDGCLFEWGTLFPPQESSGRDTVSREEEREDPAKQSRYNAVRYAANRRSLQLEEPIAGLISDIKGQIEATRSSSDSGHGVAAEENEEEEEKRRNEEMYLTPLDQLSTPRLVSCLSHEKVINASVGYKHAVCITKSGNVYTWGLSSSNRLGYKPPSSIVRVVRPTLLPFFSGRFPSKVSCGYSHTLITTADGRLFSFGKDSHGRLGVELDVEKREEIIREVEIHNTKGEKQRIVNAAAGGRHSIVSTTDGRLYSFGACLDGELGLGSKHATMASLYFTTPQPVVLGTMHKRFVTNVAAGGRFSAVLAESSRPLLSPLHPSPYEFLPFLSQDMRSLLHGKDGKLRADVRFVMRQKDGAMAEAMEDEDQQQQQSCRIPISAREVLAHRSILTARSPYFRHLFASIAKEFEEQSSPPPHSCSPQLPPSVSAEPAFNQLVLASGVTNDFSGYKYTVCRDCSEDEMVTIFIDAEEESVRRPFRQLLLYLYTGSFSDDFLKAWSPTSASAAPSLPAASASASSSSQVASDKQEAQSDCSSESVADLADVLDVAAEWGLDGRLYQTLEDELRSNSGGAKARALPASSSASSAAQNMSPRQHQSHYSEYANLSGELLTLLKDSQREYTFQDVVLYCSHGGEGGGGEKERVIAKAGEGRRSTRKRFFASSSASLMSDDKEEEAEEERVLYAHRCILETRSRYFHALLHTSGMEESETLIIYLPFSKTVVWNVLTFLYAGHMSGELEAGEDEAKIAEYWELLQASDVFLLPQLSLLIQHQQAKSVWKHPERALVTLQKAMTMPVAWPLARESEWVLSSRLDEMRSKGLWRRRESDILMQAVELRASRRRIPLQHNRLDIVAE